MNEKISDISEKSFHKSQKKVENVKHLLKKFFELNFFLNVPHFLLKKNYKFPPRAANKTTTNGPAARIKTRLVS